MLLVIPIAVTTFDWKGYSAICKEYLHTDPVSDLDRKGIKTADPFAGLEALNDRSFFLSFAVVTDTNINTGRLLEYSDLKIMVQQDADFTLLMLTGSYYEFFQSISRLCKCNNNALRRIATEIFGLINKGRYTPHYDSNNLLKGFQ
jgi:hypothetical protein